MILIALYNPLAFPRKPVFGNHFILLFLLLFVFFVLVGHVVDSES